MMRLLYYFRHFFITSKPLLGRWGYKNNYTNYLNKKESKIENTIEIYNKQKHKRYIYPGE